MQSPQRKLDADRITQANQSAEVGRSRSGLLGFFWPQKTVSPLTQQGSQDLVSAAKSCIMPVDNSTAGNGHEACPELDTDSEWSTLPEHLIEAIMHMLQEDSSQALQHSKKETIQVRTLSFPNNLLSCKHNRITADTAVAYGLQTQFAATSVSKSWRQVGRRAFFRSLWDQPGVVKHPVQLFGLVGLFTLLQLLHGCVLLRHNTLTLCLCLPRRFRRGVTTALPVAYMLISHASCFRKHHCGPGQT